MIDFTQDGCVAAIAGRVRTFVRDTVIGYEADPRRASHGPNEELRAELNGLAREAGLLSPHVAPEPGGLGLSHVGRALVFEETGYSMLGPVALNIAAPDEATHTCWLWSERHPSGSAG